MATQSGPITKIYELKTLGFDQIMTELDALAKKFVEIKKAKQDAAKTAADAKKAQGEESQAYKDAIAALEAVKIKELELKAAIKEKTNEAKAAQIARQEELNQQKQALSGNKAEVDSIRAIRNARAELNTAIINTRQGAPVEFRGLILPYEQANAVLKQLTDQSNAYTRQFQKDGTLVGEYTTGIIQAFKRMGIGDLVEGQVTKASDQLRGLNTEFEILKQELSSIKVNGQGGFETLEQQLIANRKAALGLEQQIGMLQTELRGTGDIGNQITAGLSNGFKSMKGQLAQFVLSYVGFQAAFQGILSGIDTAKQLSDATTNLEIELDKSAGGADHLVSALAKLNTRTPLTDLENIANIAAKAGVSEDNLLGVTAALDKIKIAFGSDFGDVEAGTESLVKLINVFEGTNAVTGENLLKAGNAVRTLANETVASVPFLNDFAKRMAGLKGISDIALPAVLGLASGFEQFGQSSEVAGTTLTRVIPKLATDTAKYADIAGMTQKAFAALLKDNPAEALIRVSEGLVKGKAGIEEISTAFADSNLGSGRIAAILGTVGSKADDFRKAIASAGSAFNDTTNIEAAFAAKNENLASTLDKIAKSFKDAANSTGFRLALTAIAGVVSLIIGNLGVLLTVLGVYAAAWTIANASMVAARISTAAMVVADTALTAAKIIATVAVTSYNVALNFLNASLLRAAASSAILRAAISVLAGPMGIIIGIVSLLAISAVAFGNAVTNSVGKLRDFVRQQAIANEISQKASSVIAEQTSVLNGWVAVIKSAASGADTKRAALQKLIEINPAFRDALKGQAIDLQKLDAIYKQVTESIKANAEAQASAQLTADKQKEVLAVTTVRQKLETEFSRGSGSIRTIGGFSDADIDKLFKDIDQRLVSIREKGNGVIEFQATDFNRIKGNLKRQEDAAIGVFNDYVTAQATTQAKLVDIENKAKESANKNAETVSKGFEVDVTFLKTQIDALNQQIDAFQGSQKDLNDLIKKRNDLQAKLDAAIGNAKSPGASKISGPEKDLLAQEDARRDLSLTLENQKRVKDQEDEETYLNNILKINQDSIDRKLALIKGNGIAEQKLRAQLSLDRINLEKDTSAKIQEIHNKEFEEARTKLRNQLDDDIAAIKEADNIVQVDPTATNTAKAQSKLNSDNAILALYQRFNDEVDKLEKKLGVNSVKNFREIVNQTNSLNKDIVNAKQELTEAALKDVQETGDRLIAEFKATMAAARLAIVNDTKLTPEKKDTALAEVDRQENLGILAREVASEKSQLPIYQDLFAKKKITDTEYLNFLTKMRDDAKKLHDATTKDLEGNILKITDLGSLFQNKIRGIFHVNVDEGDDQKTIDKKMAQQQLLAQTISETFSLAKTAMDDYYNAEAAQIERSRANNEKALQLEFDQKKARAQSQAEQDALDKQFAAAKEKNDRDAFEKNKKVQKQQALVNLALQLSNIAVVASAPGPANLLTVGVFGEVMYAIQTAIALAAYALNVGRINSAQFEFGGQVVPKRGGKFGGKGHKQGGAPFKFKDESFEAEVDELAIIRTRNAPRNKVFQIMGTQAQIASQLNVLGGGIQFAPGAKLKRFETGGVLGASLQAPVFVPSSNSTLVQNRSGITDEQLNTIVGKIDEMNAATNARFERIEVVQVTGTVTKAQAKQVKQKAIGTL